MAGYYPLGCAVPACPPSAQPCLSPQIIACLLQDKDLGSGEHARSINDVIIKIDKLCAALQNIKGELQNIGGDANNNNTCGGESGTAGSTSFFSTIGPPGSHRTFNVPPGVAASTPIKQGAPGGQGGNTYQRSFNERSANYQHDQSASQFNGGCSSPCSR